jgi:hypothetical protein
MPEANISVTKNRTTPGNILENCATATATVTPAPIITIPANGTWKGSVSVCAANNVTTGARQDARIVTSGAGGAPADGTVLVVAISYRDTSPGVMYLSGVTIAAGANPITLNLVNSTATTFSSSGAAAGELL